MSEPTGVVLMTFGSAVTSADVPAYMASVRGGRDAPAELIEEFRRRYDIVGRSPLVDITLRQAASLQELLDSEHGRGAYIVRAGMLHSDPRVAAAIDELVELGVRRVIGIVLAPQYSPIILRGYERAAESARSAHPELHLHIAGAWHMLPEWTDSLAARLREAMAALPQSDTPAPVIFTAHSLPRSVVDGDPGYIDQLRATASAVATGAGLAPARWQFAYQSAGHTPEPWLTPDVKDLLPALRDQRVRTVLVAPVQFLTDHLEILYDIDVAAVDEARDLGIDMRRIAMPNASTELIATLDAVLRREMAATGVTAA